MKKIDQVPTLPKLGFLSVLVVSIRMNPVDSPISFDMRSAAPMAVSRLGSATTILGQGSVYTLQLM